ncbi:hypothetical protein BOX37_26375 [Nocardia mangyaensis]|uniref:Uncharacterized protein n=1 Tax=Nocardia mangyaensis TaxID=2213200 RepID=A0A1J0VXQ9_9NOCA|nr:hypothetical protein [Nocardia mangyaensis]APE36872.1 hypothetical protein BOX37_26375 [Nocardia mangyaensis]
MCEKEDGAIEVLADVQDHGATHQLKAFVDGGDHDDVEFTQNFVHRLHIFLCQCLISILPTISPPSEGERTYKDDSTLS